MRWTETLFDAFMYPLEVLSLNRRRRRLMGVVSGTVLEIGAGTGANLRHYDFSRIEQLHLSDLALTDSIQSAPGTPGIAGRTGNRRPAPGTPGTVISCHEADVQDLPFGDGTFDTVVFSLVFCSVPDPARGLAEVRRVLKETGRLVFIEHVRPESGIFRPAVEVFNPLWRSLNGECNINRDTLGAIRKAGFVIEEVRHGARGLLVDGVARKDSR